MCVTRCRFSWQIYLLLPHPIDYRDPAGLSIESNEAPKLEGKTPKQIVLQCIFLGGFKIYCWSFHFYVFEMLCTKVEDDDVCVCVCIY